MEIVITVDYREIPASVSVLRIEIQSLSTKRIRARDRWGRLLTDTASIVLYSTPVTLAALVYVYHACASVYEDQVIRFT